MTTMFIERAEHRLATVGTDGVIMIDEPPGDRRSETQFLANCAEVSRRGTTYVKPKHVPLNIMPIRSDMTRLVQLADVVVGSTTAMVAGHVKFAATPFGVVKSMLYTEGGSIGGRGLKIHPDLWHANLYHWLAGDTHYWRRGMGFKLPLPEFRHAVNPYVEATSNSPWIRTKFNSADLSARS